MNPEWHRHCADIAAERVREATGRDIWAELGGCPRSWREAAELYRCAGVKSLGEIVSKVLGPSVEPKFARRGDICIKGWSLGICRGDLVEYPNVTLPLAEADQAWRL